MATTLNYKASNIAKAEGRFNLSFLGTMGELAKLDGTGFPDIRISKILFLIMAGGATEEQANELIDQGIKEAFEAVFEGLNKAGFLARKKMTSEEAPVEAKAKE